MLDYHWVAQYVDGTELKQFEDGIEKEMDDHPFKEIEHEKLIAFKLVPSESGRQKGKQPIILYLDPSWQCLIFRRRVQQSMDGRTGIIYLLGWKATIAGKDLQSILYILPDGSIEVSEDFNLRVDAIGGQP